MISFSAQAAESARQAHRQATLAFAIASLRRDTRSTPEELFTLVFSATVSGINSASVIGVFDDNYITIGFSELHCANEASRLGYIACVENSTGTDGGIEIQVEARGLAELLEAMSPHPVDFEGETEPFATLRLWFPMYAEDGVDGELLVENMLSEPARPLLRVELSDSS